MTMQCETMLAALAVLSNLLPAFGFQIHGVGFRVSGSGFRVSDFGVRVAGFGFKVSCSGSRGSGFRFRVSGFGFQVSGFGFQISGFGIQIRGAPGTGRAPDPALLLPWPGTERIGLSRPRLLRIMQRKGPCLST